MQKAQRDDRVDALKTIAIVLVVFTHVAAQPLFAELSRIPIRVIEYFNMPIFVVVSGLLVGRRSIGRVVEFVGRRFLALMVPRYAWVTIAFFVAGGTVALFPAFVVAQTWQPTLWFLYVLFVCNLLLVLAWKSPWPRIAVAISVVAVMATWPLLDGTKVLGGFRLPWLYPFFVLGFALGQYQSIVTIARRVPAPVYPAGFAVLAMLLLPVGVSLDPWIATAVPLSSEIVLLLKFVSRYLVGVLGVAMSWCFVEATPHWLRRPLAAVGYLSLGVYVLHEYLFILVFGSGWIGAAASSLLIVCVALGVAWGLMQVPVLRVVLLGAKPRRRDCSSVGAKK